MGKLLVLAASGVAGITMSTAGAVRASAAPITGAHVVQYNPDVAPTTPVDAADITAPKGQGLADDSTKAGALPTTGSDSARLAGEGLALVVAGTGAILVRRRYAARP